MVAVWMCEWMPCSSKSFLPSGLWIKHGLFPMSSNMTYLPLFRAISGVNGWRLYVQILRAHGLRKPPLMVTEAQRLSTNTFAQIVLGKSMAESGVVCSDQYTSCRAYSSGSRCLQKATVLFFFIGRRCLHAYGDRC